MANKKFEGNYLITADNWFYAPDGKLYRAAWGNVEIVSDEILGIKTNARSSNWFARVGSEDNHIIIAGCQIHYAVKMENAPDTTKPVEAYEIFQGERKDYQHPIGIYIAN